MLKFIGYGQLLILLVTLLASVNVVAQQKPLPEKLQSPADIIYLKPVENEKLQQYTYNKIYPAKNGKLYLGTNSGLVCYDGISIRTYSHINGDTNSLSQNTVVDIVEDKSGNLFLSTASGGIDYLDIKTGKAKHIPILSTGPDLIVALLGKELLYANLYLDNEDKLWSGSTNGDLYYYDPQSKHSRQISLDSINLNFFVSDIKQDPQNSNVLWLATHNGLLTLNRNTFKISKHLNINYHSGSIPENLSITSLDIRQDGIIWFGTKGFGMGRYEINNGLYSFFKSSKSAISTKEIDIISLSKKSDFEYYVTLGNGKVSIYNIITKTYTPLPDQFLPKEFKESKDIIADSNGNVWGIINGRLFVSYSEQNPFKTIAIKDKIYNKDSLSNELQEIIWDSFTKQYYAAFSNSDEGLFIFNDSLKLIKTVILFPYSYPEGNGMYNIALDSKRRVWGDNLRWLSVYDSNSNPNDFHDKNLDYSIYNFSKERMVPIYLKYPSLRNLWPTNQHGAPLLDILSDNETIYTSNVDSCFFIDANSLLYKSIPFRLADTSSNNNFMGVKLRIDKKNNFLYACNYLYNSSNAAVIQYSLSKAGFKKIIIPSSIRVPIYYVQFPWYELDDMGNIWICTSDNVLVYEPKTFKRIYNYEKKSRAGAKQLINITGKGIMCIMNENGIELYDYFHDRSNKISAADGLFSNSFQLGAYANDMLFVSYPGYLQYVPIDYFINNKENRICYLSEFIVQGNKKLLFLEPGLLKDIKLKHNQDDITFSISTTEFNQPHRLQYRYMLVGSDNEWNFSSFENRSITYRNLPPGTYVYEAAIKNSDGTWSNQELRLTIIIQPAFWQTLWFNLLCVVIALALAYLFFRRRINSIRQREERKLNHEKELVELEAKALRAQMNPHFIFNCLNSIKALMQEKDTDKGVVYLTTFSKLIRTLFNNADKKEISLHDEIQTCKLYLQLEAMRFNNKLSYLVNIDENTDLKSIYVPALIIQPFIENAIWHGIVPKETGGTVLLNVSKANGTLKIVIDDNGIGRESSQQNKSLSGLAHQSKGVNLTQSRLELDNLLQQRQARIEIFDKKDENGKAAGTKIVLTINEEQ